MRRTSAPLKAPCSWPNSSLQVLAGAQIGLDAVSQFDTLHLSPERPQESDTLSAVQVEVTAL
jgi:hypothetical protein